MKFIIRRICPCGKFHEIIPENHKVTTGDFNGVWFDCDQCKTTLFIPDSKIEKEVEETQQKMIKAASQ